MLHSLPLLLACALLLTTLLAAPATPGQRNVVTLNAGALGEAPVEGRKRSRAFVDLYARFAYKDDDESKDPTIRHDPPNPRAALRPLVAHNPAPPPALDPRLTFNLAPEQPYRPLHGDHRESVHYGKVRKGIEGQVRSGGHRGSWPFTRGGVARGRG